MKIRYTPHALAELDAVLSCIDERSPTGALRVKSRLMATVDLLAGHPLVGRLTGKAGVRCVVVIPYPYLIFYRASETEIVILSVRHAARRPHRPQAV